MEHDTYNYTMQQIVTKYTKSFATYLFIPQCFMYRNILGYNNETDELVNKYLPHNPSQLLGH